MPNKKLIKKKIPLAPKPGNRCFACGPDNPAGLKLKFYFDNDLKLVMASYKPALRYAGAEKFLHGGMIGLLLDEMCSKVLTTLKLHGMTRQLKVSGVLRMVFNPLGASIPIESRDGAQEIACHWKAQRERF